MTTELRAVHEHEFFNKGPLSVISSSRILPIVTKSIIFLTRCDGRNPSEIRRSQNVGEKQSALFGGRGATRIAALLVAGPRRHAFRLSRYSLLAR